MPDDAAAAAAPLSSQDGNGENLNWSQKLSDQNNEVADDSVAAAEVQ